MWFWTALLLANPDPLVAVEQAHLRGDAATVEHCLRVWAVAGARGLPPAQWHDAAQGAQRWAQAQGEIRIFASRLPQVLRVGWDDPTQLVDAITVYAVAEGGPKVRLAQQAGGGPGRLEYRSPQAAGIEILAVSQRCGGVALERATLPPGPALAPPAWTPPPPPAPALVSPKAPEVGSEVAWWWVAGGVLAGALVGFAAYDEFRK